MKTAFRLAAAAALIATGACNNEDKGAGNAAPSAPIAEVKPPEGGDWSQMVTKSPEGGFVMGNPNAAAKLIEFGSMTCPHCREFDETGVQPLIDKYVKTGQVSFEFRNYVRDPFDVTASLIARCGGEKSFFPLMRALYADQNNWMAKVQAAPPDQLQALTALGPQQQFAEVAKITGFQQWAAQRGLPPAKSSQCLADEAEVNRLVQMVSDAGTQYNVSGTPTFVLNGEVLEERTWEALEPKLRSAIGG